MTRDEALAEARRRWGDEAWVRRIQSYDGQWNSFLYRRKTDVELGIHLAGRFLAMGATWEEAFKAADVREAKLEKRRERAKHKATARPQSSTPARSENDAPGPVGPVANEGKP